MIGLSSIASALIRQVAKRALSKGIKAGLKKVGAVRLTTFDVHIFRASRGGLINTKMFSDYLKNGLGVSPTSHRQMMGHFRDRTSHLKSMGILKDHSAQNTLRFTRKGIESIGRNSIPAHGRSISSALGSIDVILSPSLRSASSALLRREATRSVRKALKKAYKSRQPVAQKTPNAKIPGDFVRIRGKLLTRHQLEKFNDLATFRNLPVEQMGLGKDQLQYLKRLGILGDQTIRSKEGLHRVLYLKEEGKRCLYDHTGRLDIQAGPYTKKASEFYHDKKAYDAYQALRAEIEREGGRVEAVQTDLHMRSQHSADGQSGYELSDLRIQYTDANGELRTLDAEVDVGYSSGLIAQKMSASPGMVWLTDSHAQAQKIGEVARALDHDVRVLVI